MADEPTLDHELFKLSQSTRSLGVEGGLSLLLALVHLRYRSMLTAAGEPWRQLMGHGPTEDLGEIFARALHEGDWRYESVLQVSPRMRTGELAVAIDQLDVVLRHRCEELGDTRAGHADVFEALLRQAPRSQSRSWEASTTQHDVAELMVRLCDSPLGTVIDPAVGLGSALLEARAAGAEQLVGWDINASVLDLLRLRADLADANLRVEDRSALGELFEHERFDTVLMAPPWGLRLTHPAEVAPEWLGWGKASLDLVWLRVAERLMRRQAVIHLPLGQLAREGAARQRADLLPHVTAVVALPPGAGAGTGIRSALVVLDREPRPGLLMMSLEGSVAPAGRRGELELDAVGEAVGFLRDWRAGRMPDGFHQPGKVRALQPADLTDDGSAAGIGDT